MDLVLYKVNFRTMSQRNKLNLEDLNTNLNFALRYKILYDEIYFILIA